MNIDVKEIKNIMYEKRYIALRKKCTRETIGYVIRISTYFNTISTISKYSVKELNGEKVTTQKWSKKDGTNIDIYLKDKICDLLKKGYCIDFTNIF